MSCAKFHIITVWRFWIGQSHKTHNAPLSYLTIHHPEQKCAHFCSECCIVGYRISALWDLWDWSVVMEESFYDRSLINAPLRTSHMMTSSVTDTTSCIISYVHRTAVPWTVSPDRTSHPPAGEYPCGRTCTCLPVWRNRSRWSPVLWYAGPGWLCVLVPTAHVTCSCSPSPRAHLHRLRRRPRIDKIWIYPLSGNYKSADILPWWQLPWKTQIAQVLRKT